MKQTITLSFCALTFATTLCAAQPTVEDYKNHIAHIYKLSPQGFANLKNRIQALPACPGKVHLKNFTTARLKKVIENPHPAFFDEAAKLAENRLKNLATIFSDTTATNVA